MMNQLKYKFARFMQGRYGVDQLSRCITAVSFVLIILSTFITYRPARTLCDVLVFASLFILYYRIFSKQIPKRYQENQKFLAATAGIRTKLAGKKAFYEKNKNYKIYKCPGCTQKLRVPKGKGKIAIRCQKCGQEFIRRT